MKTLGENLRLARRRRKITAQMMAERANMSLMTLRSLERGSPHVAMSNYMAVIFSSPLSAMALTAMLGLTGLPMGIASVACFGGAFSDGVVFKRLKLGDRSSVIGVMLEPLTQADIVTKNPIPIFSCNFFAGGLSGIVAVTLGIVNNAPGTSAPIPGLLAPFAFNNPVTVLMAMAAAAVCGAAAGYVGSGIYAKLKSSKGLLAMHGSKSAAK